MNTYTVADIRALGPCYDPVTGRDRHGRIVRTTGLLPGADWSGTVVDILDVHDCPPDDRLWVVFGLLTPNERLLLACWLVRRTPLADGRTVWDLLIDERSRLALQVAERFACGQASRLELLTAHNKALWYEDSRPFDEHYYAAAAAYFATSTIAKGSAAVEYAAQAAGKLPRWSKEVFFATPEQVAIARAFLLARAEEGHDV